MVYFKYALLSVILWMSNCNQIPVLLDSLNNKLYPDGHKCKMHEI